MSIRTKPNICYEPSILYKPEFAYTPPEGYRAESFIVPFQFNVLANGQIQSGFPWKLDDDVPWVWRGMVWPQVGTAQGINTGGSGLSGLVGTPCLVAVRDTHGNYLTKSPNSNLVLGMGALGQSGFDSINAFGFPFGCEVVCEPGGVIRFDFLIPGTGATVSVQGTMLGAKLFLDC
jgi:hypothetical protein